MCIRLSSVWTAVCVAGSAQCGQLFVYQAQLSVDRCVRCRLSSVWTAVCVAGSAQCGPLCTFEWLSSVWTAVCV